MDEEYNVSDENQEVEQQVENLGSKAGNMAKNFGSGLKQGFNSGLKSSNQQLDNDKKDIIPENKNNQVPPAGAEQNPNGMPSGENNSDNKKGLDKDKKGLDKDKKGLDKKDNANNKKSDIGGLHKKDGLTSGEDKKQGGLRGLRDRFKKKKGKDAAGAAAKKGWKNLPVVVKIKIIAIGFFVAILLIVLIGILTVTSGTHVVLHNITENFICTMLDPLPDDAWTVARGEGLYYEGTNTDNYEFKYNYGVDLTASAGTKVYAVQPGTIVEIGENETDGKFVIIDHNINGEYKYDQTSYKTKYSHLGAIYKDVNINDAVVKETTLATMGSEPIRIEVFKNEVAVSLNKYFGYENPKSECKVKLDSFDETILSENNVKKLSETRMKLAKVEYIDENECNSLPETMDRETGINSYCSSCTGILPDMRTTRPTTADSWWSWSNPTYQCVWYAAGRMGEITGEKITSFPNANQFCDYYSDKYTISYDLYSPQPGAVIVWDMSNTPGGTSNGKPGHVGVIESMDNGSITMSHGWNASGSFGFANKTFTDVETIRTNDNGYSSNYSSYYTFKCYVYLQDCAGITDTTSSFDMDGIKYYNQKWYPEYNAVFGTSIAKAGCGVTSLAIIVSTYLQQDYDPPYMVKTFCPISSDFCWGNGSNPRLMLSRGEVKSRFGLESSHIGANKSAISEALASGKLVLILVGKGTFTSGSHYMVLAGVNGNQFRVVDPNNESLSHYWDADFVMSQMTDAYSVWK